MPLSAMNFAASANGDEYAFGVDVVKTAAVLRELADKIETREMLMQSVRVSGMANHEDFTLTSVRLVIAEKHPKKLYGAGSKFPAAVATP
jgi:hypothetical protein